MNFKGRLATWFLIFLSLLLAFQLFGGKEQTPDRLQDRPLGAMTVKTAYSAGDEIIVRIQNNSGQTVTFPPSCPRNPFNVVFLSDAEPVAKSAEAELNCDEFNETVLRDGEETKITYAYWAHALFSDTGRYRIDMPITIGEEIITLSSNEFSVEPKGFFGTLWERLLYQPFYNALMFLVDVAPGKNLGIGIIFLTLIIRLILLIPSQRAISSQLRLQEVQPKLQQIQKKYKGNQERIAKETMKIWKEHKVNPFGSCLPLLIQLPILIAIFYVIRNGLNPDTVHLLYEPFRGIKLGEIGTNFLALNLLRVNIIVLPLAVGLLQFGQMKLALRRKKQQQEKAPNEMAMANSVMLYAMPVMIAIFTASMPAGVGLYWGVSTLFGIGQQVYANRKAAKRAS